MTLAAIGPEDFSGPLRLAPHCWKPVESRGPLAEGSGRLRLMVSPEHTPHAPGSRLEPAATGDSRAGFELRGRDRRQNPTPRLSRFSFSSGRRRHIRRPEELEGSYVDRYGKFVVAAILWISVMNVGDSFFTLVHLQSGGVELNPVAERLLRTGRFGFVFWKCALISLALIVLSLHKNFWLARMGLWVSAGAYTVLNLYHMTLF